MVISKERDSSDEKSHEGKLQSCRVTKLQSYRVTELQRFKVTK